MYCYSTETSGSHCCLSGLLELKEPSDLGLALVSLASLDQEDTLIISREIMLDHRLQEAYRE